MAGSTALRQNRGPYHCYITLASLSAKYHSIALICMDSDKAVRIVNAHMRNSQLREKGSGKGSERARAIDLTSRRRENDVGHSTSSSRLV